MKEFLSFEVCLKEFFLKWFLFLSSQDSKLMASPLEKVHSGEVY